MPLHAAIDKAGFEIYLKPDKYQLFLLASPIPIPFNLAVHAWFVTNQNGVLDRWEFGKFSASPHPGGIGVLHNFFKPLTGMNRWPGRVLPRQPTHLYALEEGGAHSLAARMISFIEKESPQYPLRKRYRYLGPNSNTYVKWVLRHFPESRLSLPWRAIGGHFPTPITNQALPLG